MFPKRYRNSSRAANSAVSSAAVAAAVLFGLLRGACTNYEHRSALSPVVVAVTVFFFFCPPCYRLPRQFRVDSLLDVNDDRRDNSAVRRVVNNVLTRTRIVVTTIIFTCRRPTGCSNDESCPSEERPPTWKTSRRNGVRTVGPMTSRRPRRRPDPRRPPRTCTGRRSNRIPIPPAIGSSK